MAATQVNGMNHGAAPSDLDHADLPDTKANGNGESGPDPGPSAGPSRSPSLAPLSPPQPPAPLPSAILQSIFSSYPMPITLPFPNAQIDPQKRTVCKHWLRGLCKKSDATCDYLHEYDMRKMPECRMFATFGFCNSGEDCLYRHKLPAEKRRECEEYRRGFCPKGPHCEKKHIRRVACSYYLAGFCPKGPECKQAHPKSLAPSPASRRSSPILTHKPLSAEEAFAPPPHLREQRERGDHGGGGGGFDGSGGGGGDRSYPPRGGPPASRGGPGAGGGRPGGGGRRDLSTVLCFKCGEYGHFANVCPNPNRPGNRGGLDKRGDGGGRGGRPAPY